MDAQSRSTNAPNGLTWLILSGTIEGEMMAKKKISNDCLSAFLDEGFGDVKIGQACGVSRQAINQRVWRMGKNDFWSTRESRWNTNAEKTRRVLLWGVPRHTARVKHKCFILHPKLSASFFDVFPELDVPYVDGRIKNKPKKYYPPRGEMIQRLLKKYRGRVESLEEKA